MSDNDDLFDYDAGLDEVLKDLPPLTKSSAPKENQDTSDATAVLGLDADVKVTKQRAPIAKLDEARLLSQNGIPKLRKTAKTKLKFKGKGHEISDLGRLLNFYQLWLDDLYPRAKFADGLAMIEKLGHSKRIQIMRKEWVDEEKPSYHATADNGIRAPSIVSQSIATTPENRAPEGSTANAPTDNVPPDDDLDMLLAEAENIGGGFASNITTRGPSESIPAGDAPPDDDLDMLLAEAENNEIFESKVNKHGGLGNNSPSQGDELDMLLAEAEGLPQTG